MTATSGRVEKHVPQAVRNEYRIRMTNNKETEAMKKILALVGVALLASGAMAGGKPLQLSLTPEIATYDRTERIEGLCLSIWGENPQSAFALGLVNGSTGQSTGLSLGLLNYAESYKGLQWGLVNYTTQDVLGWQGGFCLGLLGSVVNCTEGTLKGFQCGVVNYAGNLTGLQLGLLNYAAEAEAGVQIGLVNLIPKNEWFTKLPDELAPGMVIVNWRF
jgi:hypothetical protein